MLMMGFVVARATQVDEDGFLILKGVRNLTRATLDDVRQGDWLLVIVADWCGYSRRLVPSLPDIAQRLQQQAQVAVIDGEKDPSIYTQFSIDGYPFIGYVHDGAIHVFEGDPEWTNVLSWAQNKWEQTPALSGPRNPFGWQMTIKGASTHFFWAFYTFIANYASLVGLRDTLGFSVLFGVVAVIVLISIITCVIKCNDDLIAPVPSAPKQSKAGKPMKTSSPKAEKVEPKESEPESKSKEKESESQSLRQRSVKKGKGKPRRID